MIIETQRLILREYQESDFLSLFEILSDPVTMQHYPKPYDEEGTKRWINWCINSYQKNGFGLWAIILKESNTFIGDCGISLQNIDDNALYSYMVSTNVASYKTAMSIGMKKIKEYLDDGVLHFVYQIKK